MTKVVVTGERGEVMQAVRVGPAVLERVQTWDDLPRLASVADAAGFETAAWDPRESVDALPEPDCWT